jgi:hypothetical protein
MTTRKTVDEILDTAADILEVNGWVTEECYDSESGGHCAIGAVARAVYPKATGAQIGSLSYVNNSDEEYLEAAGRKKDPRHVEAIRVLAQTISRRKKIDDAEAAEVVYCFNDELDSGIDKSYDFWTDKTSVTIDEKVRLKSAKKVVAKMRRAAERYRQEHAA